MDAAIVERSVAAELEEDGLKANSRGASMTARERTGGAMLHGAEQWRDAGDQTLRLPAVASGTTITFYDKGVQPPALPDCDRKFESVTPTSPNVLRRRGNADRIKSRAT